MIPTLDPTVGQKIFKNPGQKTHEIKQINFCFFKNGQKSIFELGKSLKLQEMQFHEKNLIYLIS